MKKQSLTLLEIMMAIMIMAVVAGSAIFQLKSMIEGHRFECSAKKLKERVERAQLLALSYNTDMQITITKEKGGWTLIIHSDEAALWHLNKTRVRLSGIETISLNGTLKSKMVLDIFSNGRIEPLGSMKIEAKEKVRYLDFRTPIQISFVKTLPSLPKITIPEKPKGKT